VRRLQNTADAQDLAQETYLRFYQLTNADAVVSQRVLFRIAVNLVYEFRLRRARDRVTYDSEMVAALAEQTADPSNQDPSERLAVAEQVNRILASIHRPIARYSSCTSATALVPEIAQATN